MSLQQQLINALPPLRNEDITIKDKQGTTDIIKEILKAHQLFARDYDLIYQYFDTGDAYSTGKKIWEFLKYNLNYLAEPSEDQTSQSPAMILKPGNTVDCKHYSLFAGGVLDAIKRNEGDTWTWCYRFANEDNDPYPSHVFVVIKENGKEYWLDPCLSNYDQSKTYKYIIDKKPMALRRISGPKPATGGVTIQVDPKLAMKNFLVVLESNDLGIASLLISNPDVTFKDLKPWWIQNGGNWNDVLKAIKQV